MKTLAIVVTLAIVSMAHAENEKFYVDHTGKRVDQATALFTAMKGQEAYECQQVEARLSKSGTLSIKKKQAASVPFILGQPTKTN